LSTVFSDPRCNSDSKFPDMTGNRGRLSSRHEGREPLAAGESRPARYRATVDDPAKRRRDLLFVSRFSGLRRGHRGLNRLRRSTLSGRPKRSAGQLETRAAFDDADADELLAQTDRPIVSGAHSPAVAFIRAQATACGGLRRGTGPVRRISRDAASTALRAGGSALVGSCREAGGAALVPNRQGRARAEAELRQDPADVVLHGALG